MAISFPRSDIVAAAGFATQRFELIERQEFSRSASGATRAKSLGEALWRGEWVSVALPFADACALEAKLQSLDGAVQRFLAGDLRRPYPLAHADGDFNDSGSIHSINANNKALRIDGLDPGFILSVGDYIAFLYGANDSIALHRVMETVQADGAGLTPEFEVRPHIRPGVSESPMPEVTLKHPRGLFAIEPGSIQSTMDSEHDTVISFSAIQIIE